MKRIVFLALLFLTLIVATLFTNKVFAQACQDKSNLTERISCYENELGRLSAQSKTLSNQIAQFDAQIRLTTLKISQTEEKITLLGGRIDQLEGSLDALSTAFSSRAVETYKMVRVGDAFLILISAPDLTGAVSRFHYLQKIQEADRDLLSRLQAAQTTYQGEKTDQETLQKQLGEQKKTLDSQKAAKAYLLAATRNDEKKYQQLLAQARAEYEAIQAIIAGKGTETEAGHVSGGQRIANIIQGSSCNSGGSHVHFIVRKPGGITDNPFTHLGGIDYENCSGSSCGSSDGDAFSPGGSWPWPINPKIKFTQGYGYTWAVQNTWVGQIYRFHNGIDINSQSSSEVKAVQSGTLYQGSYNVGCLLRYVRVDHDNSDLDTLYLHVNY